MYFNTNVLAQIKEIIKTNSSICLDEYEKDRIYEIYRTCDNELVGTLIKESEDCWYIGVFKFFLHKRSMTYAPESEVGPGIPAEHILETKKMNFPANTTFEEVMEYILNEVKTAEKIVNARKMAEITFNEVYSK